MNANVPMLDEIAGKNTKEVIDALNETIRQQQAEIEALKYEKSRGVYDLLTDEEIHQIFRDESGFEIDTCPIAILDFARAILRKAQE